MTAQITCVVVSGTSSIPAWHISAGDAGARTAIGSDSTVAWQFAPGEVQPRHAELYYDGAALYICDLANMGDVRIGASAVTAGQWVPVPVGSELSIGQARLSIQQGTSSQVPALPKQKGKSSQRKKAGGPPPARTLIIAGMVGLAALGSGGLFVFKKLQKSETAQVPPMDPGGIARQRPRAQSVDHLFPVTGTEIRTRDDFSKRTDPEAKEKVENKSESSGSALLDRPEPSTLEGKAAAAAIDGDLERARELYGELVTENPSNPAFRVALEIVDRQRTERCRQLGEGACE